MGFLLSIEGRSGPTTFWLSLGLWFVLSVGLFVGTYVLRDDLPSLMALGIIIGVGLLSLYSQFCIYGRRLHDAGYSGKVHFLPYVLSGVIVLSVSFMMGVVSTSQPHVMAHIETTLSVVGGVQTLITLSIPVVFILYTLWVASLPSHAREP